MVVPRVRVLDLLVPGAVRVVEEHEADGHGADGEADEDAELHADRQRLVEERVRGLGRRDVDVDAAREGEEEALGAVAGLRREEHRRADEDGHAAQRVHQKRHALREAALRDQQEEVARLLRELVRHRRRGDRPALGLVAVQERVRDEDAVDEV